MIVIPPSLDPRSAFRTYRSAFGGVGRAARLFLAATAGTGLVLGIFDLVFNLYLHALGFRPDYIGLLNAVFALSSLVAGVPAGLLMVRFGRRRVLLAGGAVNALTLLAITFLRDPGALVAVALFNGAAGVPYWAASAPVLTADSAPQARVHVFAVNSFLLWGMMAVGSAIGGAVPELAARILHQPAASAAPLRVALWCTVGAIALSALPFLALDDRGGRGAAGDRVALRRLVDLPQFARLLVPDVLLAVALGAMILFLPLFFELRFHLAPGALGGIFAPANIAAGLATLAAPLVAARWGRLRALVALLALTVPLLALIAFAPVLWIAVAAVYLRSILRTMVEPLYSSFAMEQVAAEQRPLLGSLYTTTWSVGFSAGPWMSGELQVRGGFGLAFGAATLCQAVATVLIVLFFARPAPRTGSEAHHVELVVERAPSGEAR